MSEKQKFLGMIREVIIKLNSALVKFEEQISSDTINSLFGPNFFNNEDLYNKNED